MVNPLTNRFLARFPGPYGYSSGSDGVDETFDVICLRSERHLVSTYYWDERLPAERVARVITAALNDYLHPGANDDPHAGSLPLSERELPAFRDRYPGPYRTARSHCEYRGRCHEVTCITTGQWVVHAFDSSFRGQANLVTRVIAAALNSQGTLLTSHALAPNRRAVRKSSSTAMTTTSGRREQDE